MIKNYILDTNVLLHDPDSLYAFQDNRIYVPLPVLEELDNFKKKPGQLGANCREVIRKLDYLRSKGDILKGVKLENGRLLTLKIYKNLDIDIPLLESNVKDNWILFYALKIKKEFEDYPSVLVTKDINFRVKADAVGIKSEDYLTDKAQIEKYTGVCEFKLKKEQVKYLSTKKGFKPDEIGIDKTELKPNLYFDFGKETYGRYFAEENMIKLLPGVESYKTLNILPRNREQIFSLDALLDDNISLVTLVGQAGTGKTLLALAAGLKKVMEEKAFVKLSVTKPVIPMGRDIGFLPGSADEKIRPWLQPIYDNLEFLLGSKGIKAEEYVNKKNIMEIEVLSFIRGRSIPNHYIIIDEAQNLTPHEVKTIITRVGDKTKIIFTGDPYQIDNPYLDEMSNGLMYLASKFYDEKLAAHVTLVKGERSELASRGAEIL